MESSLVLYKSTGLQSEKQFIIEDISSFLSTKVSWIYATKYQYIKHGLNINIKLNLSQSYLDPSSISDYDYLTIKNGTERMYFYFITGKRWLSTETVEFQLTMDTLNTFKWNIDYTVNKKTLVMREHKDRFIDNEIDDDVFERNIDLKSEGIIPPLYKSKDNKILQGKNNISWILYYRNTNAYDSSDPDAFTLDNPIECFIAPSSPVNSKYSTTNTSILASSLTNDGYYYIDANVHQLRVNGVDYNNYNAHWEIHKSGGTLEFKLCFIKQDWKIVDQEMKYYNVYNPKSLVASGQSSFEIINPVIDKIKYVYSATAKQGDYGYPLPNPEASNTYFSITPSSITFFLTADSIDRTDSRNIKIIELPYAPTNITYDEVNDVYLFDDSWVYDASQKLFKLKSLNISFKSSFKSMTSSFWNGLIADIPMDDIGDTDLRNDYYESKIYHSDFYKSKFVYDSFSLSFELEKIDFSSWWSKCQELESTTLVIDFVASRNVISKFLFMFPQYITKYGTMDFDNVLPVARNNEQVIYNSQYLNYIRNGYNYDIKSKQRAEETGAIGIGLSALSTLIGVGASIATGNYGAAVIAGVGGALTIANQSINHAKNVAQTEQNIQEKLQNAKMQSVNVLNADDIDLLNAYSDNKAKYCLYEPSPRMKKALLDMFYYAGYSTNEQKIPTVNTRYWFNYLQCDLVIDETNNLPESIIQDIKNRFKEGCTFFHHHTTWDIAQEKENYETWLLS